MFHFSSFLSFCRMWEQLKRRSSYQALPTVEPKKDVYRDLHHPVFQSIRILQVSQLVFPVTNFLRKPLTYLFHFQVDSNRNSSFTQTQTIVTLSKVITPSAMHQCLKFIYTGTIDKECLDMQVSVFQYSNVFCFMFVKIESFAHHHHHHSFIFKARLFQWFIKKFIRHTFLQNINHLTAADLSFIHIIIIFT